MAKTGARRARGATAAAAAGAELNRRILSAARRLFVNRGFAATSMDEIAAAVGASKQAVYRRYASKDELFAAMLSGLANATLEASSDAEGVSADPLAELRQTLMAALELLAWPQTVALYRVLIAESRRFPRLIDRAAAAAFERFDSPCRRLLVAARQSGQLRDDQPVEDMFHVLIGSLTGWFVRDRLLGRATLATAEDRRRYFEFAWALFIEGAARRPPAA